MNQRRGGFISKKKWVRISIGVLFIVIISSVFSGLAFITKYNFYSIVRSDLNSVENSPIAYANFPVNNSIITTVIPPFFNIKTFKPDTYNVVIEGDFDSIKNVKAKLIWDKSNVVDVSLTDDEFKKGDKSYYSNINSPFFTQSKTLDFDVDKIQTIETVVEFDGIKNGVTENFTKKTSYDINRNVLYANDLIFLLFSKIFVP